MQILILTLAGLGAGILAGFLGIGGGTIIVPLLVAMQYDPVQAIATSSLSIVLTSISGTWQNWQMGYFKWPKVLGLGIPALFTAQIGVYLTKLFPAYILLIAFGLLLILNIYLFQLRKNLNNHQAPINRSDWQALIMRLITGSLAGILAGLFGVGGGIIMVPLQILCLGEPIKLAIQTSLGVVAIASLSSTIGHTLAGHIIWLPGLILGCGGLCGAQISTRFLPKLPDRIVHLMFVTLLIILATYIFWQAGQAWVMG